MSAEIEDFVVLFSDFVRRMTMLTRISHFLSSRRLPFALTIFDCFEMSSLIAVFRVAYNLSEIRWRLPWRRRFWIGTGILGDGLIGLMTFVVVKFPVRFLITNFVDRATLVHDFLACVFVIFFGFVTLTPTSCFIQKIY